MPEQKSEDTYGCDNCGGRFDWDSEIIWATTEVGFCEKCHGELKTDKVCPNCGEPLWIKYDKMAEKIYDYVCCECWGQYQEFEVQ